MNLRVCWIGGDEVGSVRHAWQGLGVGQLQQDFFCGSRKELAGLQVLGRASVFRQRARGLDRASGGDGRIHLEDYDLCLLHGLEVAYPADLEGDRFFSQAVVERTVVDRIQNSFANRLLKSIRQVSEIAVLVTPSFLPPGTTAGRGRGDVLGYVRFLELVTSVFGEFGAEVLGQPAETIVANRFTALEFAGETDNGGGILRSGDIRFGRSVLGQLLTRLRPRPRSAKSRRQWIVEPLKERVRAVLQGRSGAEDNGQKPSEKGAGRG
jgi:hypothetical protein